MFTQTGAGDEAKRAARIFELLAGHYPRAGTALAYRTPFQLFVAAVLSAQTTDAQVNRVTAELFKVAPDARRMARFTPARLEPYLRGCGIHRQKSRYLVEAAQKIMREHGGRLPASFEELVALPGAGRKTANVVLHNAFGVPALAVDTHVYRVARRLGLAAGPGVEQVEQQLRELLPPAEWGAVHHRLIAHGRSYCRARNTECAACFLAGYCPSRKHRLKQKGEGF